MLRVENGASGVNAIAIRRCHNCGGNKMSEECPSCGTDNEEVYAGFVKSFSGKEMRVNEEEANAYMTLFDENPDTLTFLGVESFSGYVNGEFVVYENEESPKRYRTYGSVLYS